MVSQKTLVLLSGQSTHTYPPFPSIQFRQHLFTHNHRTKHATWKKSDSFYFFTQKLIFFENTTPMLVPLHNIHTYLFCKLKCCTNDPTHLPGILFDVFLLFVFNQFAEG